MTTAAMTCFFHDRILQLSLSECCCSLEILIESPYAATCVFIAQFPRQRGAQATNQSTPSARCEMDCFAPLAMTVARSYFHAKTGCSSSATLVVLPARTSAN